MSRSARSKLVIVIAVVWCPALACESPPTHTDIELRNGEPQFLGPTLLTDEPRGARMFAPPYRSSIDGRVGVYACGDQQLCFDVLAPEQFANGELPISQRSGLLAAGQPLTLDLNQVFGGFAGRIRDPLLCEGHWSYEDSDCEDSDYLVQSHSCHGRFYEWSDSQNPYVFVDGDPMRSRCTQDPDSECYDLTVMFVEEGVDLDDDDRLWSTTIQVTVADAKTASAHVSDIEPAQAKEEITFAPGSALDRTDLRSPSVTGDGRLMVMSAGSEGLVYAYNDDAPCSPSGWNSAVVRRLSTMRTDPDMFGVPETKAYPRYGLAAVRFRDPSPPDDPNASPHPVIGIGQRIYGGAPWVDRRGSNLLFAAARAPGYDPTRVRLELHDESNGLLTEAWIADSCGESFAELVTIEGEYNVGAAIMGLWTDGKMVMLDGGLNLSELAIDFAPLDQCIESAAAQEQREQLEAELGLLIEGFPHNGATEYFVTTEQFEDPSSITAVGETAIHVLGSLENRLHHQASARPALPRNLVALVSNDRSTHEVAFDDFTNVNHLVVANMMPSVVDDPSLGAPHRVLDTNTIQNEAYWRQHGRSRLQAPHHGEFVGAPGRGVEPFATGGVYGRGVHLDGTNGISFELRVPGNSPPPACPNQPVQLSLWIKPDDVSPGHPRQWLLWAPDGTVVSLLTPLNGKQKIRISKRDQNNNWVPYDFMIPTELALVAGKWSHLGFFANTSNCAQEVTTLAQGSGAGCPEAEAGDSIVEFFVDGTLVERVEWTRDSAPDNGDPDSCPQASEPLATPRYFRLAEGKLRVGTTSTQGFAGWIDELRLSALHPGSQNYEEMCNLAYGSLQALPAGQGWASISAEAHAPVRAAIAAQTGEMPANALRFICDVRDQGSSERPRVLRDVRFDSISPGPCVARVDPNAEPIPAPARDANPQCIDEQLLYPEGPVTFLDPRPDSSILNPPDFNRTCVNCHISAPTPSEAMHGPLAVGPSPLGVNGNLMPACGDRRRRVSQPPARLFGLRPSYLVGNCGWPDWFWYATDDCFMPAPPPQLPSPKKTCPTKNGHGPFGDQTAD